MMLLDHHHHHTISIYRSLKSAEEPQRVQVDWDFAGWDCVIDIFSKIYRKNKNYYYYDYYNIMNPKFLINIYYWKYPNSYPKHLSVQVEQRMSVLPFLTTLRILVLAEIVEQILRNGRLIVSDDGDQETSSISFCNDLLLSRWYITEPALLHMIQQQVSPWTAKGPLHLAALLCSRNEVATCF